MKNKEKIIAEYCPRCKDEKMVQVSENINLKNQKIFKHLNIINNIMLPGDFFESPDESLFLGGLNE